MDFHGVPPALNGSLSKRTMSISAGEENVVTLKLAGPGRRDARRALEEAILPNKAR
jgi:hypothetical protein